MLRIALTLTTLLAFGVCWTLNEKRVFEPLFALSEPPRLHVLFPGFLVLALGVVLIMRKKRAKAVSPGAEASLVLAGWASSEGVAMLGALYYLLLGTWTFFAAGFLAMLISFMLLPVQRTDNSW